jgi:hypothetical protein
VKRLVSPSEASCTGFSADLAEARVMTGFAAALGCAALGCAAGGCSPDLLLACGAGAAEAGVALNKEAKSPFFFGA